MSNIMIVEDDVIIHEMIKEYLNKKNENTISIVLTLPLISE